MKKVLIISVLVVLGLAFFASQSNLPVEIEEASSFEPITQIEEVTTTEEPVAQPALQQHENALEIPRLTSDKPEQILYRLAYTTSYNNKTKNANWVAWHLTAEHTDGPYPRDDEYYEDNDVEGPKQELSDWFHHGLPIDHGHICPAGDNKWSEQAMTQSNLLTNMCPQNQSLNRGDWKELEERCRGWARHYGEVYIAAGPIFYNDRYQTIGENLVGVPDAFFKVILRMKKKPAALGFIYPNEAVNNKIYTYVTTVDKVEEITGIDFFYNLPDDIENEIEATSNFNKW